jgi:hypothetical protein
MQIPRVYIPSLIVSSTRLEGAGIIIRTPSMTVESAAIAPGNTVALLQRGGEVSA